MPPVSCLQACTFDLPALVSSHPPRWRHPHKQALYARLRGETQSVPPIGTLHYTRWAAASPTGPFVVHPCEVIAEPAFYTYPQSTPSRIVWHINFADPRLFVAYGSALLAQDELQVLEHPALASLREALLDAESPAVTRENSRATPVLITGVPRQAIFDTGGATPVKPPLWSKLLGRSQSTSPNLYGNRFQNAPLEAVQAAFAILHPPTTTHLVAIAAPTGHGRYTRNQILDILETAATAFQAAIAESARLSCGAKGIEIEIHTGWWGCGAFGGNRSLMALLQILAAKLTGIHRLVFHTGSHAETPAFDEGRALLETLLAEPHETIASLIGAIESLGYTWGLSDGN